MRYYVFDITTVYFCRNYPSRNMHLRVELRPVESVSIKHY